MWLIILFACNPSGADWIGGWVPGALGQDYPAGTGIAMPAGSVVVMQMHYNLSNWDGAPDQTALQFSTSGSVGTEAKISKLLDPRWVAGDLNIPAGDNDVVATFELPNPSQRTLSLYSAGLHMHNLGKSGSLKLRHADGSEECLLEIPEWDFQREVRMRCVWERAT